MLMQAKASKAVTVPARPAKQAAVRLAKAARLAAERLVKQARQETAITAMAAVKPVRPVRQATVTTARAAVKQAKLVRAADTNTLPAIEREDPDSSINLHTAVRRLIGIFRLGATSTPGFFMGNSETRPALARKLLPTDYSPGSGFLWDT